MSFLADIVLWPALLVTGGSVIYLHWRLRRLGRDLVTYRAALAESHAALESAGRALGLLIDEGKDVVFALAGEIERSKRAAERPRPAASEATPEGVRVRAFRPTRVKAAPAANDEVIPRSARRSA